MYNAHMQFIVKATRRGVGATWIGPPSCGFYTFAARQDATSFQTQAEAQTAADKASETYKDLDMDFMVEAATP
jgi:hypothetical protein